MTISTAITMTPSVGSSNVAFVGDRMHFEVLVSEQKAIRDCFLRCTFGKPSVHDRHAPLWESMSQWQDLPMQRASTDNNGQQRWFIDVPMIHPGWFQAKALVIDREGHRHWPQGDDVSISVHPVTWRSANTLYCAFPRMHGKSKNERITTNSLRDEQLAVLDKHGYSVIPPSGTFRDLLGQLPHITKDLGCRIIHLLPINPTPTTHARYGRFGSPYAATDFLSIDPALVEHDRKTTALDQFKELVDGIHAHGARLIIDLAINHTGWNSTLQNEHPEWFKKTDDGHFESPGAWGTIWEDLSELDHSHPALWEHLAEVFLTWCRRGVDGFRCDAGYMVPLPAWKLITQRVRTYFPNTLFLLEGLGGGWQDTHDLLQSGGMQWAYSELFQNFSKNEVGPYLDHCLYASKHAGLLVHYAETHDNQRLAAYSDEPETARKWSLLRNRLCALTSIGGGYGFTAGVEWLADEKLNVHNSRGLNWDSEQHIIRELKRLNDILANHPCFLETSHVERLCPVDSTVYALGRTSRDGEQVLVLANLDFNKQHHFTLSENLQQLTTNILDEDIEFATNGSLTITLKPGQVVCLASQPWKNLQLGHLQRRRQRLASEALKAISQYLELADFGPGDPLKLGDLLGDKPEAFLAAMPHLSVQAARKDLLQAVTNAMAADHYPCLSTWQVESEPQTTVVPENHWLIVQHDGPFRWDLELAGDELHGESLAISDHQHMAFVIPGLNGFGSLQVHVKNTAETVAGSLLFSAAEPQPRPTDQRASKQVKQGLALLTNGRGGMARMAVDLGRVSSKYDAALAINLHPQWPVDRHVFVKRIRAWADADGFFSPLNQQSLVQFTQDKQSAHWHFRVACGNKEPLDVHLQAWMPEGENCLHTKWWRDGANSTAELQLIIRPDLEDRSFHAETERNSGSEHHFRRHVSAHSTANGCRFQPAGDRFLDIIGPDESFSSDEEWSECAHPIEATRGQTAKGSAWSPGYFRMNVPQNNHEFVSFIAEEQTQSISPPSLPDPNTSFSTRLRESISAYLVKREEGKTVIAGYPWFLDWGRDTLICARGYLSAGHHNEVKDLLRVFGRFEESGTLPNIIHGDDVGNRDTVDAPLWYGVVAEEYAEFINEDIYQCELGDGRSVEQVLANIATGYLDGAANGVHVDLDSALVWSPSHFTWMDTNYPAGTPRKGYPLEIQALWIRLLRQLDKRQVTPSRHGSWADLAQQATQSFDRYFWLPELGWWADCLIAEKGVTAQQAVRDTALRSNAVLPIALGVSVGEHARSTLRAVAKELVVPGALRSLAPLPVHPGNPVRDPDGNLLNDPRYPYQGHYQGEEDRERKPAYHNGTAWTWTFPGFCEALIKAWPEDSLVKQSARSYLLSGQDMLDQGCIGQLPEIIDGNFPHQQRGCDAQAWGSCELLRVLIALENI